MKRVFAILLSICLLASLAVPALAAPIKTSGAASTLRLESVDGTAQLKNASGKTVKVTNGSRLYNGYKLATEKASYAYVSLDDAKAIKLDASSSSEVFQSGKKLELKVTSGQMFFNVTAPLKSDEALNIRTSTMVTGVRGTSGWVSVIDRFTTQISLLEGELTITSTDPLTGLQRTITIVGGQTATIVYHGKDKNYESEIIIEDKTIRDLIEDGTIRDEHIVLEETGLTVENLQEEDVPGFVAMEVKKDKELQKKIEENSPLSVPEIIGDAGERLEKEEAAAEAADKAIQEEMEKVTADDVDPLFKAETPSGGGGGSSVPTYNLTVTKQFRDANGINTLTPNEVTSQDLPQGGEYSISLTPPTGYSFYSISGDDNATLTDDTFTGVMDTNKSILIDYRSLTAIHLMSPTVTQVNAAYNNDGYTTVYVTGTISTDQNNTDINLASGKELRFTGSSHGLDRGVRLNTAAGSTVVVEQNTFTNSGIMIGQGTMTVQNGATLNNQGTIQIDSNNSLHIQGKLINNSSISVGAVTADATTIGLLAVEGTGEFTNAGSLLVSTGSSVTTASKAILTNSGTIANTGTITNNGTFSGVFGQSFNPTLGNFINNGTLNPTDDLYSMVLNANNQVTAWKTMDQLFAADGWTNGATHTLVGKQTSSGWSMISTTGQIFTLDLNGRTLTLPDIFHISGGSVTIQDSSVTDTETATTTGTVSIADMTSDGEEIGNTIIVLDGGSLTLKSGTIESPSDGTAVQVGSSSDSGDIPSSSVNTFIMNGGTVNGNINAVSVARGSSFTMNDGTVEAAYTTVNVERDASFTMNAGEVTSTLDTAISLYGAFIMNGGTVIGYTNGISTPSEPNTSIALNKGTVKIENDAAGVIFPYGAALRCNFSYSEDESGIPICPTIQINNVSYTPKSNIFESLAEDSSALYIPCNEETATLTLGNVILGGKTVMYYIEGTDPLPLTPAIVFVMDA